MDRFSSTLTKEESSPTQLLLNASKKEEWPFDFFKESYALFLAAIGKEESLRSQEW